MTQVVYAHAAGVTFFHEPITTAGVAGSALIAAGIYLVVSKQLGGPAPQPLAVGGAVDGAVKGAAHVQLELAVGARPLELAPPAVRDAAVAGAGSMVRLRQPSALLGSAGPSHQLAALREEHAVAGDGWHHGAARQPPVTLVPMYCGQALQTYAVLISP